MTFGDFPSSTMDFPGPAAPRPKGPKRTRVPPTSEGTKNVCNWKTGRIVRNQTYNPNDWTKFNLQLNELNNFWCFSASERPRAFGLRWRDPGAEKRKPQTSGSKAKLPETSIAEASSLAVEVSISIGMPCKRNLAGTMWKKCRHGNLQHQFMPSHPKQPMGNLPMPKNCS